MGRPRPARRILPDTLFLSFSPGALSDFAADGVCERQGMVGTNVARYYKIVSP